MEEEEEEKEAEEAKADEQQQLTEAANMQEGAEGHDKAGEGAEEDEEEDEEEDDAGSGPDEDRQPTPAKRAAQRSARRQSAPASMSSATAASTTATPTKRTQRPARQAPATSARKTDKAKSSKKTLQPAAEEEKEDEDEDEEEQQAAEPAADEQPKSTVKAEQEADKQRTGKQSAEEEEEAAEEMEEQSVKDDRKSPRLRSQLTPASSAKKSTNLTPRKRTPSPMRPATTPATASSANKKQRGPVPSTATAPVICSALPDVTLFCDDVINATFDTLEDEMKRERDSSTSSGGAAEAEDDEEGEAAGVEWLQTIEQAVSSSLTANLDKCEQYLQTNVWSVPAEVEEQAREKVLQRPKHSPDEVKGVEAELAQLRQQIVNVSVLLAARHVLTFAALHSTTAVVLTAAYCCVLFDVQQRHIRQQLKGQSRHSQTTHRCLHQ